MRLSKKIATFILILIGLGQTSVFADQAKLTDLAALNVQQRGIQKLEKLVIKYQGDVREPELLSRLGDLYLESTGITFRISEGIKDPNANQKPKSALYVKALKDSIRSFGTLISKYPNYTDIPYARFKRGKAFKELGMIKEAREDFLYLDAHYAKFEYLDSALLDLADFSADENKHKDALIYLGKLEKMTGSGYYPIALHRSAWSHFNLGNYETAIDYLRKEIKSTEVRDIAFVEGAFNDMAFFFFEAINKKASFVTIKGTLKYLHQLDRPQFFGPTALRLAKLLKAYDLVAPLTELKDRLIEDEETLPETSEVALLIYQYQFDKRNFKDMTALLKDLKTIRKSTTNLALQQKIEGTLGASLGELHKLALKNKTATERATLLVPIVSLTNSVTELLGEENATSVSAKYALAETEFQLGDFTHATQTYLQLTNPKFAAVLTTKKVTPINLSLRLLSSRYQELKAQNLISEQLQIKPITEQPSNISAANEALLKEWVQWIDQNTLALPGTIASVEEKTAYRSFAVEANKLVYEYRGIQNALPRLELFGFQNSDSAEGVAAVSIILDTLSKSKKWPELYTITQKVVSSKPAFKDKTFVQKVFEMSADAHLKVTLAMEKDPAIWPEVLQGRAKECLSKFAKTLVAPHCQMIQAKLELKLGNAEDAIKHLSALTKTQTTLLLLADAKNQLGRFDEAIKDLSDYQNMTQYKDPEITQTILQHYWFKRDLKELNALIKNPKVCSGKNAELCERYQVVEILNADADNHIKYQTIYKNTIHGPKSLAAVWALLALEDPKKIPFNDRLVFMQRIASTWEELNPTVQIQILPVLQERIKNTMDSIQVSAPGIAHLSADPNSIVKRMKLTQEIDTAFAKTMKLPWIEIKIKGVAELEVIYKRLVEDLKGIQTPEDLLKPFYAKVEDIQKTGLTLQDMTKEFQPTIAANDSKAKTADRKIASSGVNLGQVLLSSDIQKLIPTALWNEWKQGVTEKKNDYLFYLISLMENNKKDFANVSPVLKGLVLLNSSAPTEAFELIRTAPQSDLRDQLLTQFKKPERSSS